MKIKVFRKRNWISDEIGTWYDNKGEFDLESTTDTYPKFLNDLKKFFEEKEFEKGKYVVIRPTSALNGNLDRATIAIAVDYTTEVQTIVNSAVVGL